MPSRQDQLHSYQYSLQRVVAALVTHDPDPHRSPLRRAGTTALISVVVAALAVTAAAVWGILTGAGTDKVDDESAVYLEKGTGARYVYLKSDGRLHPVLNYASGLLIAGGDGPNVVSASRKSLAKVPLGDPLGIPNAPDSLPEAGTLLTGAWSVCTQAPDPGAGSTTPRSTVLVGRPVTDGVVAGAGHQALLVSDPDGERFLVYGNRRFLIPADHYYATLRAFRWGDQQPWPVAQAWSNAIPQGRDVTPLRIPGAGRPSAIDRAQIGQLVTDGSQWAVAMADGAAGVTDVQAKLLQTGRDTREPVSMSVTEFNNLPPSGTALADPADPNGLPATVPAAPVVPRHSACVTPAAGRDDIGLRIDPTVPAGMPATPAVLAAASPGLGTEGPAGPPAGEVKADFVVVPRGQGALVAAAASPTAPAGTGPVSVITDTGRRYPIADRELLGRLGYGGVSPVAVPSQLTDLLPEGPALDADKARQSSS